MDMSHVIKKIRYNILKSGTSNNSKRHLKFGSKLIEWEHFSKSYLWDISTNPFPIHYKLTQEHIYVTSEGKMRNHLAEDVLNPEMLHLLTQYWSSLSDGGKLDATMNW